jgi:hypothetical protein
MFISVDELELEMGVNKTIGRFFVDRKPPENNSFWKARLLYIGFANGFVSIPVYYDILNRIGLPVELLLEEKHIRFMEQLMHFAILREKNEISYKEELDRIRDLLKGRIQDISYYELLSRYLDQPALKPRPPFGLSYSSLNRADVFLYVLCDLPLTKIQWEKALRYWYLLHPSYLIMDDIRDYDKDKASGDDNIVLDLGGGTEGFEKAFEMLKKNGETMEEINPLLANLLMNYEDDLRKFVPVNI